ncbi:MAG: hypothetical protein GX442_25390 [Candidatus Riflebacteria bacterium]|nr:hypothetical protein [Candidatus Riflebacteria bacterium]
MGRTLSPPPTQRGITLVEVLVGLVFLSFVMFSLFTWTSISQRSSMDAAYEFLARQLANEPIEVFQTFGYEWASAYGKTHSVDGFPLAAWTPLIPDGRPGNGYPAEAAGFRRRITLVPVAGPPRAIRIQVEVAPIEASRAQAWLTQDWVQAVGLIVEGPP